MVSSTIPNFPLQIIRLLGAVLLDAGYVQCSAGGVLEICPHDAGCRLVDSGSKCAIYSSAADCKAVCDRDCVVAEVYTGTKTYGSETIKSVGRLQNVSYCGISDSKLKYAEDAAPLPEPVSVCRSVLTVTSGKTQEKFTVTQMCPQSITCSASGVFTRLDVYASSEISTSVQKSYSSVEITGQVCAVAEVQERCLKLCNRADCVKNQSAGLISLTFWGNGSSGVQRMF